MLEDTVKAEELPIMDTVVSEKPAPPVTSPKREVSQVVAELIQNSFFEATEGWPFASAQELIEAALPMLMAEVTRIPIIAVRDGDRVRVFMGFLKNNNNHENLWESMIRAMPSVAPTPAFVTAIEGISPFPSRTEANPPNPFDGPYVELDGEKGRVYFQLAPRSAITESTEPRFSQHPLRNISITSSGHGPVTQFFEKLPGAKVVNLPPQ